MDEEKCDTFKVYLARDNTFAKKYVTKSVEEAYEIIYGVQDIYDEYLIILHKALTNEDEVLVFGRLDHNKTKGRKR